MTQPTMLPLAQIDLDGLADALNDGGREYPWYFHTGTGDVRAGGADWDEGYEPEELEEQGWAEIHSAGGSRASFEDMELFAQAVGDVRMKDVLTRSLEGKGAFRRFREARSEYPELKDPWSDWVQSREQARSIQWLLEQGYIDELEVDAALALRRAGAAAALDVVRRLGGAVYDIDAVSTAWADITARLADGQSVTLLVDGVPYAAISRFDR